MAYPKELRKQLGLSLAEMSTLIHCGQSLLSMVEMGKRELPTICLGPLWALETAAAAATVSNSSLPNAPATIKWLKRQLRNGRASRQRLQLEREKLEEQAQQVGHWLETAVQLTANPYFNGDDLAGMQFQLCKRKAEQKLQQLQLSQYRVQVKAATLDANIAAVEALLDAP